MLLGHEIRRLDQQRIHFLRKVYGHHMDTGPLFDTMSPLH